MFSLVRNFPDQWYHLNDALDPSTRSVTITLRDIDFSLGIEDVSAAAVAVQLASSSTVPDTVVSLHRGSAGGDAITTNGIASTRRGSATSWSALVGTSPVGDWQVSFGDDARALFDSGDLILVISWKGQALPWAS